MPLLRLRHPQGFSIASQFKATHGPLCSGSQDPYLMPEAFSVGTIKEEILDQWSGAFLSRPLPVWATP